MQGKARLGSIESCAGSDSLTDGSVGQFKITERCEQNPKDVPMMMES
jgi:hypothetical protein